MKKIDWKLCADIFILLCIVFFLIIGEGLFALIVFLAWVFKSKFDILENKVKKQ